MQTVRAVVFPLLMFGSVAQASAHSLCTEGSPIAPDPRLDALRPTRTAQCPYDFPEVVRRITRLSSDRHANDTVENIERAFGIPKMTTSYDDARIADYSTILSGKDGWRLIVWVREAFYPLNKGPARFRPGLRPTRLYGPTEATLIVDLNVVTPNAPQDGSTCLPVATIKSAMLNSGWRDATFEGPGPTDGGTRSTVLAFKNKHVVIGIGQETCTRYISLTQSPSL